MTIKRKWVYIILVASAFYIGLIARLYLATIVHRSDVDGFLIDAKLFTEGKNIYLFQPYYNYSPLFFYFLGFLAIIQKIIAAVPLRIIILWSLILTDLITCFILIGLARQRKINILQPLILFFLNPIIIIITAYHGQFDNIAIMFLLLGIYLYGSKIKISEKAKTVLLWAVLTLGLTIKHVIIYPVYVFWLHFTRKIPAATLILFGSIIFFGLTFIPFLPMAREQIIGNVFKYRSMEGLYGISFLLNKACSSCNNENIQLWVRNLFLLATLTFTLFIRNRDVAKTCLVSFLFFLTFTTGIGGQYFIFPVALGALFPSIWFYLYTVIVTLFLLGNFWEFNIPLFSIVSWNVVWVVTLLWFISELIKNANAKHESFEKNLIRKI